MGPDAFRAPNGVWEFPLADFLVLARPDIHGLFILNPTARFAWDIFRTGASFGEAVREFARVCGIPEHVAAEDLTLTLSDWRSGLLSPDSPSPGHAVPGCAPPCPPPDAFARDYAVLGKSVRIVLHTAELAAEISPRLESLPAPSSAPSLIFQAVEDLPGFLIFMGESCVAREETIGAARAVLLQEIVRACRGLREWLAILHAGACGSDSRCVVFPGSTQSGKSTLAAVLMQMGMTFYSEDSVLIEPDTLTVPAMPFALMIREGSWPVLCPRHAKLPAAPIVSRFGQRVRFLPAANVSASGSGRVAALVFSRFEPGAGTDIRPLDTFQTLLRLQESGFWVAHDRESIAAFLGWIQSVPSHSIVYSDVDEAAAMIRDLLKRP